MQVLSSVTCIFYVIMLNSLTLVLCSSLDIMQFQQVKSVTYAVCFGNKCLPQLLSANNQRGLPRCSAVGWPVKFTTGAPTCFRWARERVTTSSTSVGFRGMPEK